MKVRPGDTVRIRDLRTIDGVAVAVPNANGLTHLQFRRFAGCPICNLHLQSVITRHSDIQSAGIREVVVFHSTTDELSDYADQMPFAVIGDPDKRLYHKFGVESSPRSITNPRAITPVLRNMLRRSADGQMPQTKYPIRPRGGRTGLPADMLIDTNGHVIAVKYGKHAYDQWSVDELLSLAASSV